MLKQYRVCDGCGQRDETTLLESITIALPQQRQVAEDDATVPVRLDLCARCLAIPVRLVLRHGAALPAIAHLRAWAAQTKPARS